jgi:hypothetical protein
MPGRRLAAAIAVLALLSVAASFAPAGGAAAAECEWSPHKVRVVVHVKRHGKRVKLVRKRVRWSCVPVPAATPVPAPAPAPAASPPPVTLPELPPLPTFAPEDLSNPHFLGAQAYEFGFTATKPSFELAAGVDTIELINVGQDAHDLHLESLSGGDQVLAIPETASRGNARASAILAAGEYRLYCSLDDHVSAHGMERRLLVTP